MDGIRNTAELLEHIRVKKTEECFYEGMSENIGSPNIYGGQVLAQSLAAAYETVDDGRLAHSIHAYFFLPGDYTKSVLYRVETIRDGRSFTTRNIKAIQNDKVIFQSIISFQTEEKGLEHQFKKPFLFRRPSVLLNWEQFSNLFKSKLPRAAVEWFSIKRPIEFKPVEVERYIWPGKWRPKRHIWFRFKGTSKVNISKIQLQQMLLYASDYNLLFTAAETHTPIPNQLQMASIDHAMWFHRDFDASENLLFALDSPSSSNARGFTRGNIFTASGKLVASVTQEGLMRVKKKKKPQKKS